MGGGLTAGILIVVVLGIWLVRPKPPGQSLVTAPSASIQPKALPSSHSGDARPRTPELIEPPKEIVTPNSMPSVLAGQWFGDFTCHVTPHMIEMNFSDSLSGLEARVFVPGIGAALYRVIWNAETNTFRAIPVREIEHIRRTTWLQIDGHLGSGVIEGTVSNCGALRMNRTR